MRVSALVLFVPAILLMGCGGTAPIPEVAKSPHGNRENVKIVDGDGQLIGRLKADHKGYKVYDDGGNVIARLKVYDDHIKAMQTEEESKILFKLKRRGKKYKSWVAENEEKIVLFTFSENEDGGYEIANGYGELLFTVKRMKDHFAVFNGKDQLLAKLTVGDDRVICEGPDGKKKLEVKGSQSAIPASAMALEGFNLPRRAAFFAFLHQLEAGDLPVGM